MYFLLFLHPGVRLDTCTRDLFKEEREWVYSQMKHLNYVLAGLAIAGLIMLLIVTGTLGDTVDREETYYAVGYHWGYAVFDANGTEYSMIDVPQGTELTLVAVNDHAHDAIDELPAALSETVKDIDWKARTVQHVEDGEIPAPEDSTIEEEYETVHELAHGHSNHNDDHDEENHNNDTHEDGTNDEACGTEMDHTLTIGEYDVDLCLDHEASEPSETTFTADEQGTFTFICMNYCGYGHSYQQEEILYVR